MTDKDDAIQRFEDALIALTDEGVREGLTNADIQAVLDARRDDDYENDTEPRAIFGSAGCCLHCLVWEIINKHAPDNPHQAGTVLYDPEMIVGNLVDVMAELLAGIPELHKRKQFFRLADERLRAQTAQCLARGDHPGVQKMRKQ